MPLVDMPLEQLETYTGITPRPADFDEYWSHALAELEAQPDNVELIDADFDTPFARCRHLFFSGVRGARVHAKLLEPKHPPQERGPALLRFHGYSGGSGDWFDKLPYVAAGFTVAALDCRGQAGLSEDSAAVRGTTFRGHIIRGLSEGADKLLFRSIFLDTAQLARIVANLPSVDPDRISAAGGSQGGGLTLACAALYPSIKLAAPVYPFLSDYKRVWEMDLAERAYAEIREYLRAYDPLHERVDEMFNRLGYIDVHHLAPRIKARVLMSITLMDDVCPPSTQFAAYNAISSQKDKLVYPDFKHERLPGNEDRILQFLLAT